MTEIADDRIRKARINLARNNPVSLVVGAAGFLGSHLTDKLLDKGIQVIGIDDLAAGDKQNLAKATENRNFHLVIESADQIDLDLERLDYIFIASYGKWSLDKVLELFKKFNSRCLLISSIGLYEKGYDKDLTSLKNMESKLAKFASEFFLNARVLRLGSVYGPRMDFTDQDPTVKLIQQALIGDLQKDVFLEFSSRALYASDAVDLIIRTIFAGSTSQKIFDGVNPAPVKVSEIKQVLLDPVWYESRDFVFAPLPPWPTPNLPKTVKLLNWQPSSKIITNLRETLSYFKDNEIKVPQSEVGSRKSEDREEQGSWDKGKKEELEAFKQQGRESKEEIKKKGIKLPKFSLPLSKIYFFIIMALVAYALIWPGLILGWGVFTFSHKLGTGLERAGKGEFEASLSDFRQAREGIAAAGSVLTTLEPIRKTGLLAKEFALADKLINVGSFSAASAEESVLGIQALLQSIKMVTGEKTDSPLAYFDSAKLELFSASANLSKTNAILQDENFKTNLPAIFLSTVNSFSEKLAAFGKLVDRAAVLSILLPKFTAVNTSKNYLVLLQDNMELRPAGGIISSFAKVSFAKGKLTKLEVDDTYNIDANLKLHVEPPKEIKEDLGQKDWFLQDANWEPDFPESARQAEWFYTKETAERMEGVVGLDISAMAELLKVTGPVDLPDYNEKITNDNLFAKAVTHAEVKKSFLTALASRLFNKIFFLPQNNWPGIISAFGKSLEEKHISIYLNDPQLFSYALLQNFSHILPRQSDQNKNQDFLSMVEGNLGANKANYYLDRSYQLETVISKTGEVNHRLRISYTNRSPSDTFPAGKYKNRMRVYLPFGSKLIRALWGESDITKDATGFVDYSRSGYSMRLELEPKEQKTLVLDYSVPVKLEFKDGTASYRLDIIKQLGTFTDPFVWTIAYPISFKANPQEQTVSTDLSTDRSFEVEFTR